MPVGVHSLDNPANDEFSTFCAARGKEHVKVMLAILSPVKLIKCAVREAAEALCTPTVKIHNIQLCKLLLKKKEYELLSEIIKRFNSSFNLFNSNLLTQSSPDAITLR